jgi:Domain of unknown function (DUF4345)
MNPRPTAAIAGTIILLLGLAALVYPQRVIGFLGYAVMSPSDAAAVLGEVRATYGGLFAVMGLFTLIAAANPVANRSRLLFVGLLWLGACGGRLVGVFVDGNPGIFGWGALAFELVVGGALVIASQAANPEDVRAPEVVPTGA